MHKAGGAGEGGGGIQEKNITGGKGGNIFSLFYEGVSWF